MKELTTSQEIDNTLALIGTAIKANAEAKQAVIKAQLEAKNTHDEFLRCMEILRGLSKDL